MASSTEDDGGKKSKSKLQAANSSEQIAASSSASPTPSSKACTPPPSKKRKRAPKALPELDIDISLPEPPSKRALRKLKKGKPLTVAPVVGLILDSGSEDEAENAAATKASAAKHSDHGVWIGNLPWTATKASLQSFLVETGGIEAESITRVHMPGPQQATLESWRQKIKPTNRGFAYVDFSSAGAAIAAVGLSETLLAGRRVLIKDAKSFDGRPAPVKDAEGKELPKGNPPGKRIFVGNLAFDTAREELKEHFAKCGDVADVFVATFEDSGKCKGYAWVTFEEVEAAEKAVRGWVEMTVGEQVEEERSEDEAEAEQHREGKTTTKEKKPKIRKWWVNRIKGRPLRMEFAEDKAVRYKKRYGKGGTANRDEATAEGNAVDAANVVTIPDGTEVAAPARNGGKSGFERKTRTDGSVRYERKVDARTIKPGAALAGAHRLTGAIVESQGKKTTFA